jgi:asparagine synthase (glutamine-hydrolysing)
MADVVERGALNPFSGGCQDAVEELERVLSRTIREQMVADVPLGAFLSGGVDSSVVVALMQLQSVRPIKTFTIKFDEPFYDESAHARAVATHLHTDHTELTVTADEARSVIPLLPEMYDEPFSDSSQIPTYFVSKVARSRVTVSLSGDGGDEMFGGYPRYARTLQLWNKLRWSPSFVRTGLARALTAVPTSSWDWLLNQAPGTARARATVHGDRIHKLAAILAYGSLEATYRRFVTHWPEPSAIVTNAVELPTALTQPDAWPTSTDLQRLMYLDAVTYLPDDIFTKVDRASMAISLETRAPFVDPRVVELAWQIPPEMHYHRGRGKLMLRSILDKYVPASIIERPKMGFGIPLEEWLRGPLREWGEALLNPARLAREGFFNVTAIREKWDEHQRGARRWHYHLWDVLMFQAWLERQ